MAVKLIANYAKRLGLPGYSSHQFSVSVETELHNVEDIEAESARLYGTLQQSVDEQIRTTGFVPPHGYGMKDENAAPTNGGPRNGGQRSEPAGISEKQLDLINRIVRENNVSKTAVDELAVSMFGGGVRTLNRLQASGLIYELFERYPRKGGQNGGNGGRARDRREAVGS